MNSTSSTTSASSNIRLERDRLNKNKLGWFCLPTLPHRYPLHHHNNQKPPSLPLPELLRGRASSRSLCRSCPLLIPRLADIIYHTLEHARTSSFRRDTYLTSSTCFLSVAYVVSYFCDVIFLTLGLLSSSQAGKGRQEIYHTYTCGLLIVGHSTFSILCFPHFGSNLVVYTFLERS